jgi:hypothetical protein
MIRKTISLLIILSLFQVSAFAANCDIDCLFSHSGAAHVHPDAPHQHQQSSSTSDTHCKHAHAAAPTVAAASSCHQGMSAGCAHACVSNAKASGASAPAAKFVFVFHAEKTALLEISTSRTPDLKLFFSQSRSAPTITILRI